MQIFFWPIIYAACGLVLLLLITFSSVVRYVGNNRVAIVEKLWSGKGGVRSGPLLPGKYAFNTYAGKILPVPTTNFISAG